MIEVHDDIIPIYLQNYIENIIIGKEKENIPFAFLEGLTDKKTEGFYDFGWSHVLFLQNQNYFSEYMHNVHQILYYFSFFKKLNLKQIITSRIYFQHPSSNPGYQPPHVDLPYPHFSCIYYVNDSDGDTVFYDNDKNIIKKVSPKKGRIIFFEGSINHSGSRPKNKHRIIINFNFLITPFLTK